MAKPNYSFEKRQRELAKKKKKEEKLKEKAVRKSGAESSEGEGDQGGTQDEAVSSSENSADVEGQNAS